MVQNVKMNNKSPISFKSDFLSSVESNLLMKGIIIYIAINEAVKLPPIDADFPPHAEQEK